MTTEIFNIIISIGIIVFQVLSLFLIYMILRKKDIVLIKKNYILIGFIISLGAVVVSLIYSSVIGYEPCLLCWWARILIFPQLLIFGVALFRKDFNVFWYSGILSLAGIIVSGYHTHIERGGSNILNCEAVGASCLTRYVYEFGYITIAVMALSGFVLLFLLALHQYRSSKN